MKRLFLVTVALILSCGQASQAESSSESPRQKCNRLSLEGINAYRAGKFPEAEDLYKSALKEVEGKAGLEGDMASVLSNLALLYSTQGRDKDAEEAKGRASAIEKRSQAQPSLNLSKPAAVGALNTIVPHAEVGNLPPVDGALSEPIKQFARISLTRTIQDRMPTFLAMTSFTASVFSLPNGYYKVMCNSLVSLGGYSRGQMIQGQVPAVFVMSYANGTLTMVRRDVGDMAMVSNNSGFSSASIGGAGWSGAANSFADSALNSWERRNRDEEDRHLSRQYMEDERRAAREDAARRAEENEANRRQQAEAAIQGTSYMSRYNKGGN